VAAEACRTAPHPGQKGALGYTAAARGCRRGARGLSAPWPPPLQRKPPYLYTDQEVARLIQAAGQLPSPRGLRAATYSTVFGLLAATGMRPPARTSMSERSRRCARPLDERSWLTQHGPAELLLEQLGADCWQDAEDAVGVEEAGGDQGVVDVRVSIGTWNRRLWTSGWKGAAQHFRDNEPVRAV
jgi:hypothetical protein